MKKKHTFEDSVKEAERVCDAYNEEKYGPDSSEDDYKRGLKDALKDVLRILDDHSQSFAQAHYLLRDIVLIELDKLENR